MSYHTHNLEPGDIFYSPEDLDGYADYKDVGNYEVWRVIHQYTVPTSRYGQCHIVAECLSNPALRMDRTVDRDISLCMVETDEALARVIGYCRGER